MPEPAKITASSSRLISVGSAPEGAAVDLFLIEDMALVSFRVIVQSAR